MDMQSRDLTLEILKWIGLAFAAGFIGYFGRYLSMAIIEKLKKRKQSTSTTVTPYAEKTGGESSNNQYDSKAAKLEKKKAKDQIKKTKKELKN